MSMFGLIVTGRLVQTNFEQLSLTRLVATVVDADNISDVVVFLTGCLSFPEGTGGLVFYSAPDETGPPTWQLLGDITNKKPSVLFKIPHLKKGSLFSEEMMMFGKRTTPHLARFGISIEPLAQVVEQVATVQYELSCHVHLFGQKMVENFVNYISSFIVTPDQMVSNQKDLYVPASAVQTWFEKFMKRLKVDPNFWRV